MSSKDNRDRSESAAVPKSATWFLNGFHRFLRPYLNRHFHSIAIDRESMSGLQAIENRPVIVYANHPSWWDPLIAHFLHRKLFGDRDFFAPIDDDALQQYRVFEKLGFYGVSATSASGVSSFLKKSAWILEHPDAAIWMTPEGRFADVRDRDAELMPGLAHLCSRCDDIAAIPLALEYVFWDDRLPVCLVSLGTPLLTREHADWTKPQWSTRLSAGLRDAQDALSQLSIARQSSPLENLLAGKRGGGWFYDTCRRIKATLTGKPFRAHHGDQFQ